jgi:uroporphyrin-3 C-methyltransferase
MSIDKRPDTPVTATPVSSTGFSALPAAVPETGAGKTAVASRLRDPLLWVAVVLLLLIVAQWWEARDRITGLRDETATRLAESDRTVQEGQALARADRESLTALQSKISVLEARLAETQSQSVALEAMYQDIVRGRDERLLAEIEQSIAIAAQQLQLAGNIEAALIALQTADARLAGSAQSRFLPIRRLIARDIERLKSLPTADLSGLSLKIENVVSVIDGLPLAYTQRPVVANTVTKAPPLAEGGMLARFGGELWQDLRQLIRIERIDQGDPALLAPTQTFFLRENLRLRLLSARLALLQRESVTYRDDLRRAQSLLERYYDIKAAPVQTALATVKRLAEINPALDLPTLTETLTAVRNLKLPKETGR